MVDDVDLIQPVRTEDDLVEFGVVVERVAVRPVTVAGDVAGVDVDPSRVFAEDTVVGQAWVGVLDHVIPQVPSPDDFPGCGPGGHHFDDLGWPDLRVQVESAHRQAFALALPFPSEKENVAVWHRADVVVGLVVLVGPGEIPEDRAIKSYALDAPSRGRAAHRRRVDLAGAQEIASWEKVCRTRNGTCSGPRVHDGAIHVNESRRAGHQRVEEGVPFVGFISACHLTQANDHCAYGEHSYLHK